MFKQFNQTILKGLNIMEAKLDGLLRMRSDKFINIKRAGNGTTLSLNMREVRRNIGPSGGGSGGDRMAYVETAPGAVTTVECFLDDDTTGEGITVNCSVIGGSGSEKLNDAIPRLVDGSLIFVKQFSGDWWCTSPFIATDDCLCVQDDAVFNSVTIAEDERMTFNGVGGDSYLIYDSAANEMESWVNGVKVASWQCP